ncbi:hypothetical protein WSO01_02250 [Weissella soli]|jgi:hypothetical protein|nr:hypothetical protein WSO01_02250 [Weissella soli]
MEVGGIMAVAPYDLEPDDDSRWQGLAEEKETLESELEELDQEREELQIKIYEIGSEMEKL